MSDEHNISASRLRQLIEETDMNSRRMPPHDIFPGWWLEVHLALVELQACRAQWAFEDPKDDGVYLCWTNAPPQSTSIQVVRRKDGRWLTSWPVVAWQKYPDAPRPPA
jgi:hypothetical protein